MDKITKALKQLSIKEKKLVKEVLSHIADHNYKGVDVKKLKGRKNIFRVRKGDIRIIFCTISSKEIKILTIERRSEKTYK